MPLPPALGAPTPSTRGRGIFLSVGYGVGALLGVAGGFIGEAADELHLKLGFALEQLE